MSTELINIVGKEIAPLVYQNQRVLTMKMIDELHERKADNARRRFNENRDKFIEGEDFFELSYVEWSSLSGCFPPDQSVNPDDQKGGHRGSINVLTETGYLLLVKSFNDDLAWQVQRALVNTYFMVEQVMNSEAFAEYQLLLDELAAGRLVEVQPDEGVYKKDEIIELQRQVISGLQRYDLPTTRKTTKEEESLIIDLCNEGAGPAEIGKKVKRTVNGVKTIIRRLRQGGRL